MLFKITFKPQSSFVSNLKSSTLFGALCWAINDKFGEDVLKDIIFKEDTSLAVSDVFPDNCICTPYFKCNGIENMVTDIRTGVTKQFTFTTSKIEHCIISRDSNNSLSHWENYESYTNETLSIYVYSEFFSKTDLTALFEILFTSGIGKYRSKGKGQFKLLDIKEFDINTVYEKLGYTRDKCNGYMVLSGYIPNKSDSTLGSYTARVVNGIDKYGTKKQPVCLISSGACFLGKSNKVIGKLQYDKNTDTYTSGRAITIPISITS